jgi:hypothetical protein
MLENNIDKIEVLYQYKDIESIAEPQDALNAIQKMKSKLGHHDEDHMREIRCGVYIKWLCNHGRMDWAEHMADVLKALGGLRYGVLADLDKLKAPEGYIIPFKYFNFESDEPMVINKKKEKKVRTRK